MSDELLLLMAWQPTSNAGIDIMVEYGIPHITETFEGDMNEFW